MCDIFKKKNDLKKSGIFHYILRVRHIGETCLVCRLLQLPGHIAAVYGVNTTKILTQWKICCFKSFLIVQLFSYVLFDAHNHWILIVTSIHDKYNILIMSRVEHVAKQIIDDWLISCWVFQSSIAALNLFRSLLV